MRQRRSHPRLRQFTQLFQTGSLARFARLIRPLVLAAVALGVLAATPPRPARGEVAAPGGPTESVVEYDGGDGTRITVARNPRGQRTTTVYRDADAALHHIGADGTKQRREGDRGEGEVGRAGSPTVSSAGEGI